MLFCVSSTTCVRCLRFDLNENNVSVWCCWHRTAYVVYVQWILSKMAPGWRRRNELRIKSLIFVFFAHKEYSRSFVKLRSNHWCHTDYFNNVFWTVIVLGSLLSMGGPESSRNSSKISFVFRRSHRFGTTQGWVINDRIFHFWVNYPFKVMWFFWYNFRL